MSQVLACDCADYEPRRVGEVIAAALDFSRLSLAGRSVFIKPNLLSAHPPEKGVTTHPVFVRELIAALKARGAGRILVGDNPGIGFRGYADFERLSDVTGMGQAAGDKLVNIGAGGRLVEVAGRKVLVSREVLEADVVISLPRLKTHTLAVFTGAIKNMFGILVGYEKVRLHREFPRPHDFSRVLADVCAIRPPELTILDAVVVMEGNGPSAGSLKRAGKILASTDAVALDATVADLIGVARERLGMLARGQELRLGNQENIQIEGKVERLRRFRLPVTVNFPAGFLGYFFNRFGLKLMPGRQPCLIREKCTGCGQCVQNCPVQALELVDKKPRLDKHKCICCFCCHEICPEGALRLKIKW